MLTLMNALAVQEGYNLTALPDVRILRADRPLSRTPVLYDPGIVIVCQGSKRGFFGQQTYLYDEQHYLAVSVPVRLSWKPTLRQHIRCWRFIYIWIFNLPLN
jgi:hypothetical protein